MTTLRIVDAHHHLWNLEQNYYPWLSDRIRNVVFGDYAAIRRNYLIEDFLSDARDLRLAKSVHVQADFDPNDPVGETKWLQSVADSPGSKGFPHAIVAYADLARDDAEAVLDQHCMFQNVRGIRQMLHHSRMSDQTVSSTDYMHHPVWLRNLDLLRQRNLSFDLQVFPEQMQRAAEVVQKNPRVQFILCHTGSPVRRSPEGFQGWERGLCSLAELPNVAIKISGLGMYDPNWTVETIRPFVTTALGAFGVSRCMFASNFPVDSLMSTYAELWEAFDELTAHLSESDRAQLFAGNAEAYYRI